MHAEKFYAAGVRRVWYIANEQGQLYAFVNLLLLLFSEFESRQNLDQSQMSFDYLVGYIMSISMYMQNFITIFHSGQEIGPFSRFQNLELGTASTDEKCLFAISWTRSY